MLIKSGEFMGVEEGIIPTSFQQLMGLLLWNLPSYKVSEIASIVAEYGGRFDAYDGGDSYRYKYARVTITPKYHKCFAAYHSMQTRLKAPVMEAEYTAMFPSHCLFAELTVGAVSNFIESDGKDASLTVLDTLRSFYKNAHAIEKIIATRPSAQINSPTYTNLWHRELGFLCEADCFCFAPGRVKITLSAKKENSEAEDGWAESSTVCFGKPGQKDNFEVVFDMNYHSESMYLP